MVKLPLLDISRKYGRRGSDMIDISGFEGVSMMLEILKARFSEHKELHPGLGPAAWLVAG